MPVTLRTCMTVSFCLLLSSGCSMHLANDSWTGRDKARISPFQLQPQLPLMLMAITRTGSTGTVHNSVSVFLLRWEPRKSFMTAARAVPAGV